MLSVIDNLWMDHLDAIENLREGIGLRGYGQKDPLVEYKNESYRMFKLLLSAIDSELVNLIFKLEITPQVEQTETKITEAAKRAQGPIAKAKIDPSTSKKGHTTVGRNDPCPCGSG